MTNLKCSAITCAYNENNFCSRGEINVMGSDAKNPEETRCGSFVERGKNVVHNSYSNSTSAPSEIKIECQAHNCNYNHDRKCTAASVGIAGSDASDCHDTRCSTFYCCK